MDWRLTTRRGAAVGMLASLGVVAGCRGSKTPSVANIGRPQTTTAASASGSRDPEAFARCMTSHGFAASLGSAATANGALQRSAASSRNRAGRARPTEDCYDRRTTSPTGLRPRAGLARLARSVVAPVERPGG